MSALWESWSKTKKKYFSKKITAILAFILISLCPVFADGDLIFNVHGYLGSVFSSNYNAFPVKSEYGGGIKISYRTPSILEFSAGFDYLVLPRETKTDEKLDAASLMRANVGIGCYIPIAERFAMVPFVNGGVYRLGVSDVTRNSIFFGAGISFQYKINPHVFFEAPVIAEFNRGVLADVGVAPGVSINISKMLRNDTLISMNVKEMKPIFPVLYSWYEKNPFATVTLKNEEECGITNVTVSFFQGQYMGQPQLCASYKRIEKEESVDVDLVAFFNEQMLELIEKIDTQGSVIVEYRVLGQKKRKTFPITLGVYGRNSMSWDDDRRAAVFVSSKDPAAMLFSRHVMSSVRNNLRSGVPINIQYAMGIFEAMDEFGINYVIDPNSSYSDNVGSTSIDFLQFPYQTLMYRGGDCDDLSILTCSLFESVGVHTAFITIPGHIFIAFDSGVKQKDAWKYFNSTDEYIISDGEIWVPLEITLSDEGYTKAWRVGAREWHVAARTNEAQLYKMRDSWNLYKPVGVSGAHAKFLLPEKKQVLARFSNSVDYWITRELDPQIRSFKNILAKKEDPGVRNDFGILYVRYGLFDEAEKQFRIARKYNNKNALLNTASMYFAKEQYENAAYMYRQVINNDPKNILAYLGLARCAFEVGDYETCDDSYSVVRENDMELAMEYAYLGSFETVRGRAFSLSERLEKTIWVGSNAFMNGQYEIIDKSLYDEPKIGLANPYIHSTRMEYKIPELERPVQERYQESEEDDFVNHGMGSLRTAGDNSADEFENSDNHGFGGIKVSATRRASEPAESYNTALGDIKLAETGGRTSMAPSRPKSDGRENPSESDGAGESYSQKQDGHSSDQFSDTNVPDEGRQIQSNSENKAAANTESLPTESNGRQSPQTSGNMPSQSTERQSPQTTESPSSRSMGGREARSSGSQQAQNDGEQSPQNSGIQHPQNDGKHSTQNTGSRVVRTAEKQTAAGEKRPLAKTGRKRTESAGRLPAAKNEGRPLSVEKKQAPKNTEYIPEYADDADDAEYEEYSENYEGSEYAEDAENAEYADDAGYEASSEDYKGPEKRQLTSSRDSKNSGPDKESSGSHGVLSAITNSVLLPIARSVRSTIENSVLLSGTDSEEHPEPQDEEKSRQHGESKKKSAAIRFGDGRSWKKVSVNTVERKPVRKTASSKDRESKTEVSETLPEVQVIESVSKARRRKQKMPFSKPECPASNRIVRVIMEEDLKKKRFYVSMKKFRSVDDAYRFWLSHPDLPCEIVRTGYSEYTVFAGDYSKEEYEEFIKNV